MMVERVCHCPGNCGRYVPLSRAVMAPQNGGWVQSGTWPEHVYTCPRCDRMAKLSRLRALVQSGERRPEDWNEEERAVAAELLGRELAAKPPARGNT